MKVKKAIIPAAGLGTRFLPATKSQPKEMIPIVDKPSIQYIIEEIVDAGIEDILIITSRDKGTMENYFDKSYELEDVLYKKGKTKELQLIEGISNLANINYIRQKEPKGLGHAIYKAKAFVGNEPFAVLLGDDIVRSKEPCIGQMIKQYEKTLSSVIGIKEVEPMEVSSYGIIDGKIVQDRLYKIKTMVEKPNPENAPTNLAVIGRYIINPEIFECIERTKPGKNNEIQLTDALALLLEKQSIYGYEFVGKRYDVGNKVGYLKATVEFALEMEEIKDEFAKYCRTLIDKL